MAGPIQEITVDDTSHSVVDVIFNTKVLKDIEHKKDQRNLLVHLALDYLEEVKQIKVSRKYKTLKTKYKGNSSNLTKYLKPGAFGDHTRNGGLTPSYNKGPAETKDTLLAQLSSIAINDNEDKDMEGISLFDKNTKQTKKGLIEELTSEVTVSQITEVPKYDMVVSKENGKSKNQIVVTVQLPKVSSVSECELDVSEVCIKSSLEECYTS